MDFRRSVRGLNSPVGSSCLPGATTQRQRQLYENDRRNCVEESGIESCKG
jgi:hypothetical protein